MAPRPLVAGNWKMNGSRQSTRALVAALKEAATQPSRAEVLICPPTPLLAEAADALEGVGIELGAQDCHAAAGGAHTGDVAAEMLADLGCSYVIVGHSERRTDHGESDTVVRAKAEAAHRADLSAIVCLGETEAERDADETLAVVGRQLADSLPEGATPENTVVAYEPVWAIGTGRTPSEGEISVVHRELRDRLVERFGDAGRDFRLLYGGSVKPDNAVAIMKLRNVDGGLIGGASLKAEDFWPIVEAC
ncbi:MAG TPA: triose-phosphate isomerase [Alphaproteobacteria bacterium]|jgi:triosephosphate isomerase|nr:triose-phosphate isomerase [Alphaproteobacteria bacterium]